MNLQKRIATLMAAAAMALILGCAPSPTKESTGQYVDDSVITAKVKAAIFKQPELKSAEINVETFRGAVQLSGFVGSQANITTAIDVARSIDGVNSVKNDMRLK